MPLLFVMVLLIVALLPTFPFGSDEGDNILGAFSVLNGGDVYRTFYSQHMPFGYYFTALLALCGAESVPQFRIAYAVFLALFWAWLCWSYARRIPAAMLIFLLLAFPLSAPFFLGHVILADNLSSLALLTLLLELIVYDGAEGLKPARGAVISLAAFVAITSCFLSVYPVFAFIAGLILLDLRRSGWRLKYTGVVAGGDDPGPASARPATIVSCRRPNLFPFRQYILLAAMMTFPFAVLIGWYALTGNLGRFYFQAYEFNRTVYAKYVWGGNQPALLTAFFMLPLVWIQHAILAMKTALQTLTLPLDLLLAFANLGFIIFIRRGLFFSVVLFFFLVLTGTRSFGGFGYTGFHSAPYFMVSLVSLGWLIALLCPPAPAESPKEYSHLDKTRWRSWLRRVSQRLHRPRRLKMLTAAGLLVLFLLAAAPGYLRAILPVYGRLARSEHRGGLEQFFATPYDREIKALTRPGDRIWSAGINGYIYINNRCLPAGRIPGLVPWFVESYTDEIIADLDKNKPRVVIFPAEGAVWGHALKDFGRPIFSYIQAHYHPLDANAPVKKDIYVLNDQPSAM